MIILGIFNLLIGSGEEILLGFDILMLFSQIVIVFIVINYWVVVY